MKYILFFLICLIIACSHTTTIRKNDFHEKKIEIPLVIHLNPNYISNINKFREELNKTYIILKNMGLILVVDSIKTDSPLIIKTHGIKKYRKFFKLIKNDKKIHVFFVYDIKDKTETKKSIVVGIMCENGTKKYITISKESSQTTLAHEIGHYFGLGHINNKKNIMDQDRTKDHYSFTHRQIKKIRRNVEREML